MHIKQYYKIFMPYCLQKAQDGGWILLNRNYKPLGFATEEWVEYENFPISSKLKGLGPKTLRKLASNGGYYDDANERVFLYTDATDPSLNDKNMQIYLEKIEKLMKLTCIY